MIGQRIHKLNLIPEIKGSVLYWMSREQRVDYNYGLQFARQMAENSGSALYVTFCHVPEFIEASDQHYSFMFSGIKETASRLFELNIPFVLLRGVPYDEIFNFIKEKNIKSVVSDFDPLKIKRDWTEKLNKKLEIPFFEADSHNIVPCRIASQKQEFSARTIRPKIMEKINYFLEDFDKPSYFSLNSNEETKRYFSDFSKKMEVIKLSQRALPPSGESAANKILKNFIENKLEFYTEKKNKPELDATSNLSAYLHFGQISSQEILIAVQNSPLRSELKKSFIDEIVIRKELSDNFCLYNLDYDSFDGFPKWAKETLNKHRRDEKLYIYTLDELENAKTHDEIWNAAQMQLTTSLTMHGYLRMYWAKKILEWSPSPEIALESAIYLNNKYQLDGRDPNGYAGIAWSIGGVHDRPWFERPIFGSVRYMSHNSQIKKINLKKYLSIIDFNQFNSKQ